MSSSRKERDKKLIKRLIKHWSDDKWSGGFSGLSKQKDFKSAEKKTVIPNDFYILKEENINDFRQIMEGMSSLADLLFILYYLKGKKFSKSSSSGKKP